MPREPQDFTSDPVSANQDRQQGLGVGQSDPVANAEPAAFADDLEAEVERLTGEDFGPPIIGAQHGENHTRRPDMVGAMRAQGPKTRAANKERVKGSRLFNPR